ncbi:MAG: xanthine dehydrogenase family protein molybdopterin-binding subunit, partial [Actinomycetota bacterium]
MADPVDRGGRVEDPALLRGQGRFVGDLRLENAAAVTYVTSDVSHASFEVIDVDVALGAPGVLDVVTAADLADAGLGPMPGHPKTFPRSAAQPVLADGVARFVGEPIAAIVAETRTAAADAAELVEIDYSPLDPVIGFGPAEADGTLLFPDHGSNLLYTSESAGAGFVPDEVVVEATLVNQRVAPCPIEGRTAAAWWDGDRLVHHASCQGVHPQRWMLKSWY